jgi:hypothetical protein
MKGAGAFVRIRYVLLGVFLIALLGLAFSYGQYSVQGLAVKEIEKAKQPEVKTYTKAFCTEEDGIRDCKDKMVVVIDGKEYVTESSEVKGSAQFPDE